MPNRRNVKSEDARLTDGHERARNFLSDAELDALLGAARKGRHGVRDYLLLLMMVRHGLRVSEAIRLRRQDLNLGRARVWIGECQKVWGSAGFVRIYGHMTHRRPNRHRCGNRVPLPGS